LAAAIKSSQLIGSKLGIPRTVSATSERFLEFIKSLYFFSDVCYVNHARRYLASMLSLVDAILATNFSCSLLSFIALLWFPDLLVTGFE
jgi:hypothetical protein